MGRYLKEDQGEEEMGSRYVRRSQHLLEPVGHPIVFSTSVGKKTWGTRESCSRFRGYFVWARHVSRRHPIMFLAKNAPCILASCDLKAVKQKYIYRRNCCPIQLLACHNIGTNSRNHILLRDTHLLATSLLGGKRLFSRNMHIIFSNYISTVFCKVRATEKFYFFKRSFFF